jgi:hypothetical protein
MTSRMSVGTCRIISASITPTSARVKTLNDDLRPLIGKMQPWHQLCSQPPGTAVARRQPGRRVHPDAAGTRAPEHAALFLAGELYQGAAGQTSVDEPGPVLRCDHGRRSRHARPAGAIWGSNRPIRSMRRRSTRITCRPITILPNSSKAPASCAGLPILRRLRKSWMRKSARDARWRRTRR